VFGIDPRSGGFQEPHDDSKWTNQRGLPDPGHVGTTQYLYIAAEGVIWGDHNMIIFLDTVPDHGMSDMSNLNSWATQLQVRHERAFPR